MITRINRLVSVLVIVGIALYLVIQNRETMTVHLGGSTSYSGNAGVILIATFVVGFLVATLIASMYGIRGYFRERRLKIRDRDRELFYEGVMLARAAQASKEFARARELWSRIINKDPTNIIARVELSKVLENAGEVREALRAVDEARTAVPNSIEVLFRAAELNLALNNKTAALDNLALILYNHPNRHAALLARDLSEELNRIEDALEYQKQFEAVGPIDEVEREQVLARLRLKQTVRDGTNGVRENISAFLKRHPDFPPALELLADEEVKQGNSGAAAELLARAARNSGTTAFWQKLTRLWLSEKNPQKALASAKAALQEAKGSSRLVAELEIVRLLLNVDLIEEAETILNGFKSSAKNEAVTPSDDLLRQWALLKSLAHLKRGETKAASEILFKLCDDSLKINVPEPKPGKLLSAEAPAPRLTRA